MQILFSTRVLVAMLGLFLFSCSYKSNLPSDPTIITPRVRIVDNVDISLPDSTEYPITTLPYQKGKFKGRVCLTFVNPPDSTQLGFYYDKFKDQLENYHILTDSLFPLMWDNWHYTSKDPEFTTIQDLLPYSPTAGEYAEKFGCEDTNIISVIVLREDETSEYGINGFVKGISEFDIRNESLCTLGHSLINEFYTRYDYNYVYLSYTGLTSAPNTLAHELGHFLMLPHDTKNNTNIMFPFSVTSKRQEFRSGQLDTMWSALQYRDCVIKE